MPLSAARRAPRRACTPLRDPRAARRRSSRAAPAASAVRSPRSPRNCPATTGRRAARSASARVGRAAQCSAAWRLPRSASSRASHSSCQGRAGAVRRSGPARGSTQRGRRAPVPARRSRPAARRRTHGRSPACGTAPARLDQGLVDEVGEQVDGFVLGRPADPGGRVRRRAAAEHRQPRGQRLFGRLEQVPAPADDARRVRCRGAADRSPRDSSRNRSSSRAVDLLERQRPQPRGRELDGQRQSVECPADPHAPRRAWRRRPETGAYGGGPVGEQPHRRMPAVGRRVGRGQRAGRGYSVSPVMPQPLPAGDQDPQAAGRPPAAGG